MILCSVRKGIRIAQQVKYAFQPVGWTGNFDNVRMVQKSV